MPTKHEDLSSNPRMATTTTKRLNMVLPDLTCMSEHSESENGMGVARARGQKRGGIVSWVQKQDRGDRAAGT
jgi:hypothetical protein